MMQKFLEKKWWIISTLLLVALYLYGFQKMYFHQDDLDWFLMAHKPFLAVMNAPIGDHVDYVFRLLLKLEWDLFHLYFPAYLLVSVVMHAIVVWLLYKLARETSGRVDLAAFVALIFTINTNWTEVVLWISGQTISITVLFVLLAMFSLWKKRGEVITLFLAGWTSALAIGLPVAAFLVYGFTYKRFFKNIKITKIGWGAMLSAISIMIIYLWKGTDGTKIVFGLLWGVHVAMVWTLMMVNSVLGRLFMPFDRFEMIRIGVVCLLCIIGLWKWRTRLVQIWNDNWSRFLIIQICIYYLIVAVGRTQYGVGIMRAERYAYLGLALILLLGVRIFRKVSMGRWIWIVPIIVVIQCIGLYRRAEDYIIRPQQLKSVLEGVRRGDQNVNPDDYLPHFVLNDERLKYSDLMMLLND